MKLTAKTISPLELSANEIQHWSELCETREHLRSSFYSPYYVRSVAAVRPDVRVLVLQSGDRPVGFLPFQFRSKGHRLLHAAEPAGSWMSDYFGLVADAGVHVTGRDLVRWGRLSSLSFTHLDESQLEHGLEGEKPEPGLQIRYEQGGRVFWEERKKEDRNFWDATQRRGRQIEKEVGPLRFEFREANYSSLLEDLIRRKREQYQTTNSIDALAEPWTRELLRNLAGQEHPDCTGVLSVLYAGDTWAASHFGLRCHDVLHQWFPVHNAELNRYSPGRLLMRQILEGSDAAGVKCFDFGAGDTQAKRDFANHRHMYYRGAWYRPDVRTLVYRAGCSMQWRLRDFARRWKQEASSA